MRTLSHACRSHPLTRRSPRRPFAPFAQATEYHAHAHPNGITRRRPEASSPPGRPSLTCTRGRPQATRARYSQERAGAAFARPPLTCTQAACPRKQRAPSSPRPSLTRARRRSRKPPAHASSGRPTSNPLPSSKQPALSTTTRPREQPSLPAGPAGASRTAPPRTRADRPGRRRRS